MFVLGYKPYPWDVWRAKRQCPLFPPAKCERASGKTVGLAEITFTLIFHEQTQGRLGEVHINDILKQYKTGCATGATLQPLSWAPWDSLYQKLFTAVSCPIMQTAFLSPFQNVQCSRGWQEGCPMLKESDKTLGDISRLFQWKKNLLSGVAFLTAQMHFLLHGWKHKLCLILPPQFLISLCP